MKISPATLPALGDVRAQGAGNVLIIDTDMRTHEHWPRYTEAIASAVSKGAGVQWTGRGKK